MTTTTLIFAQASAIAQLVHAVNKAAADADRDDAPAKLIVAEGNAATTLPHFGFTLETRLTPRRTNKNGQEVPRDQYTLYVQQQHVCDFVTRLQHRAIDLVQSESGQDNTLIQRIDVAALEAMWREHFKYAYPTFNPYSRYGQYTPPAQVGKPTEAAMPYHIAFVVAAWIGAPWQSANDAFVRQLPNMPLRLPTRKEPWMVETEKNVRVACSAYALVPAQTPENPASSPMLVYASLIGQQKELHAVKAALVDSKRGVLHIPYVTNRGHTSYYEARRRSGKGVFHSFVEYLPESDHYHMVMQMREVLDPKVGMGFPIILPLDGTPDLAVLFKQLDMALRLPLDPVWMQRIWNEATVEDAENHRPALIVKIESEGCKAYWVKADDDVSWAKIIARCAGATGDALVMEAYGDLHNVAAVEEVVSEAEATEDDSGLNDDAAE